MLSALASGTGIGLRCEDDGRLIGYVCAVENPGGEAWTLEAAAADPSDFERIVGEMLGQLVMRGVASIAVWVHAQGQSVTRNDLTHERTLLRMSKPLHDGKFHADHRADVRVQGFRPGVDEGALLDLNNAAFDGHPEQSGWGLDDLAERMQLSWFDPQGLRMVWIGDRLAAFNWTKLHENAPGEERLGEIYVIAVDPQDQGGGLGRLATLGGLEDLAGRQGAERAFLYVDQTNHVAVSLYSSLGFEADEVHRAYRYATPSTEY